MLPMTYYWNMNILYRYIIFIIVIYGLFLNKSSSKLFIFIKKLKIINISYI